MTTRGVADAVAHARSVLSRDLGPELTYHSLWHTADEVVPAVRQLTAGEGVTGDAVDILVVAAWFHDIGYTVAVEGHERIGATMAAEALPTFGFSDEQVDLVAELILATHLPQRPASHLQEILCDADLCSLGQDTFWSRSVELRNEMRMLSGVALTDEEWNQTQTDFLTGHAYWTATARALWGEQKAIHLAMLEGA